MENKGISWQAPEHLHSDKGSDWFFALGILTIAVIVAALLFGNFLFAILAFLSGASIAVAASQPPQIVTYGVYQRGIRVDNTIHPYATLRSFYINDDDPRGPQLLVMSQKLLTPMIIMPIPPEYIDEIEDMLVERLPEEYLEIPLVTLLLERVGVG